MSGAAAPRPVDMTLDKTARELRVEWDNGRKSVYGFDYLAAMCPCANCRETRREMENNPLRVVKGPLGPAEMADASMVGRYALSMKWQAGCASGIYSFDYLYDICPARAKESLAAEGKAEETKS